MERSELEHIIRAAAAMLGINEYVVVGSQSVLGAYPNAPDELKVSMEADLYPPSDPDKAEVLSVMMGELSPFFEAFGIYADGVSPETAKLPEGWQERLVRVQNENTNGAIGWCLDPTDLAIAKHVAGREKDIEFTAAMVRYGLVDRAAFLERLETVDVTPEHRDLIRNRLTRQLNDARGRPAPPPIPDGGA